jgi:hypothetical protein
LRAGRAGTLSPPGSRRGLSWQTDQFPGSTASFIDEARAAGANPILVTSLTRRRFKNGKIHSDLFPYVDEAKKMAAEMNVPGIDLHAKSINFFKKLGPDGSKELSPSIRIPARWTEHTSTPKAVRSSAS